MERFRLTSDDIRLMELVMKVGIGKTEHAKKIYGDKTNKWQKRLVKLSKRGYIERGGGYIQLTFKGIKELVREKRKTGARIDTMKILRTRKWEKARRAVLADILLEIIDDASWEFQFGIDLKRENALDKGSRLIGAIKRNGKVYAVYHFPQKKPPEKTVARYVNEMVELPLREIKRVLLIYEHKEGMDQLEQRLASERYLPGKELEDLIALQSKEAAPRFKKYMEWAEKGAIGNILTGLVPVPARGHADYRWGEYDVVDLVVDRPIKRAMLNAYYGSPAWYYGYPVVIICAEPDYNALVEAYPWAGFVVLSEDLSTVVQKKAPEPTALTR